MKKKSFFFACCLGISLLTACLAPKPLFTFYSDQRYSPKPAEYQPVVLQAGQPSERYTIIGRIVIVQDPVGVSEQKVIENFKQGCREMGGDGLLNIHKESVDPSNPLMPINWAAEVFIWQK